MQPRATVCDTAAQETRRHAELKRLLEERRAEMDASVRDQLSSVRNERSAIDRARAIEYGEMSDAGVQEDIALALVQMRVETIARIDAALARLDAGRYGHCLQCGEDISAARLGALPFAVRCVECEAAREQAIAALHRRTQPLFDQTDRESAPARRRDADAALQILERTGLKELSSAIMGRGQRPG